MEQKSQVTCPKSLIKLCYLYPLHGLYSHHSAEIKFNSPSEAIFSARKGLYCSRKTLRLFHD